MLAKARFQTGLFGVYQTSVDGYAPIEHSEANGRRLEQVSERLLTMPTLKVTKSIFGVRVIKKVFVL
jgi:hypothetical protein